MSRKIKTTITVNRERLLLITPRRGRIKSWCKKCDAQVILMGIAEAAVTVNITQRSLFRRIEAGDLHFVETGERAVLVCLTSLTNAGL